MRDARGGRTERANLVPMLDMGRRRLHCVARPSTRATGFATLLNCEEEERERDVVRWEHWSGRSG